MSRQHQGDPSNNLSTVPLWTQESLQELASVVKQSVWKSLEGILVHEKVKILSGDQDLADMFHYTIAELAGMTVLELTSPDSHPVFLRNVLLKYDKPYELIGLRKDGSTFAVQVCDTTVVYQERSVQVMAMRHITEQRQADVMNAVHKAKVELDQSLSESATQLRVSNERLRLELYERERMQAELKARARQQAAIAELGQRALANPNLSVLLSEAALLVTQTLQVEYSALFELIAKDNTLLLREGSGWQHDEVGQMVTAIDENSLAGYTLLTGNAVMVEDFRKETHFKESSLTKSYNIIAGASVLVKGSEQAFGVLSVFAGRKTTFTEDDIHFLQAVANVLAMAIERKQTENQIIQRNRELLVLQSAGAVITSSLDLQYVLNAVIGEMINLLDVEICIVSDWDESRDTVSISAEYGPDDWRGDSTTIPSYHLAQFPTTKHVLTKRQATQLTSRQTAATPGEYDSLWKAGIKTLLLLPMIFQGRVMGLVEIMDRRGERTFSVQELGLAQLLANHAASAIENAQFYAETRKLLREQIALREAVTIISSTLELNEVLNHIAEQMGKAVDVTSTYICSYEHGTQTSTILAEYIAPDAHELERISDLGRSYHLSRDFPDALEILEGGEPAITHIDDLSLPQPTYNHLNQFGAKTTLIIPMQIGGQSVAYAELWESRYKRQFAPEEIALCQDIAQQAAIAIRNARLFEQTQTALKETDILYRVTHTLTQMDNEEDMFKLVLTEYLQYLGLEQGGVLLFDDDEVYGFTRALMIDGQLAAKELRIPVAGNPAYDQLRENKKPVVIFDVSNNPLLEPVQELTKSLNIKSMLLVPIIIRGKVIGALGADATTSTYHFTDRDVALVQAAANQLSTAIENIHLIAQAEQRAAQLTVIHELDRAITTSLRLSDIQHAFARHAARLLSFDRMSIALLEGDQMHLVYVEHGNSKSDTLAKGTRLPRQTSAIGWAAGHGQPLLRHNIPADSRYVEDETLVDSGIQSSMIIPLRSKGKVIGTWNIGSHQLGHYGPNELEIATSVADQLAIAIENAQLFEQARQEIAERKRAEAALEEEQALLTQRVEEQTADLRKANQELARAARLKDEFLASMSHELRTPLTAILGLVDVLKTEVYGPLTEKQSKSINSMEESGRHLLDLINDILDLSKIEAGKLELNIGPVAVEPVCMSSIQFIRQTALKKKIEVSLNIDKAVTLLQADDRRLKQILVNLLSNAVKFTQEGGQVGLDVSGDTSQQLVHFRVWDTGIGITEEDMQRLFQPFVQLDSRLSRHYSGTGLGLALVRRMAEMHKGQVSVSSRPGQGSQFTVSLPWDNRTQSVKTIVEKAAMTGESAMVMAAPETKKLEHSPLILVAEDDPKLGSILNDYLEVKGFEVTVVQNGLEVLEQVEQTVPDLILMDVQMPQMDGLEATRHLRANASFATLPIIVLTALAMPGDREKCMEAGASTYLTKPINLKLLVEAVETQLSQAQQLKAGIR